MTVEKPDQEAKSSARGGPKSDEPSSSPLNTRAYKAAVLAFGAAVIGGFIAAFGYATSGPDYVLGGGLALALCGIGFGLVAWAKYLDFDDDVVQMREPLRSTEAELDELEVTLSSATESAADHADPSASGRRKILATLLAGSFGSLAVGFIGPIGSLGPQPRGELTRTAWRAGKRLVTSDGSPIAAATASFDQLATVFPSGDIGRDDSQVVLLRVQPELLTPRTVNAGAIDGWVAYSKICTHAGCSVGLFGVDNREPEVVRQLVCPCHQSVFDPVDGARPVGGPAPRSLPQLPMAVDDDGFLIATADFDRPVGPISWDGD